MLVKVFDRTAALAKGPETLPILVGKTRGSDELVGEAMALKKTEVEDRVDRARRWAAFFALDNCVEEIETKEEALSALDAELERRRKAKEEEKRLHPEIFAERRRIRAQRISASKKGVKKSEETKSTKGTCTKSAEGKLCEFYGSTRRT